jgi:hypothetical protein
MAKENLENRKLAVERYLDQIKILSALATALLLAPAAIQVISDRTKATVASATELQCTRLLSLSANVAFLLVILVSYLIYSSLVGEINRGTYDVYRKATRLFSIAQIVILGIGLILLTVVFYRIF